MKKRLLILPLFALAALMFGPNWAKAQGCGSNWASDVLCIDAGLDTFNITGFSNQVGFSGPGVVDSTFNPAVAGIGLHTITAIDYVIDDTGAYNPISGSGTNITLGDDQVSSALPIGFDFLFFCDTFTNIYASSNGFLTFNANNNSGCCSGQLIPNTNDPNNLIAHDWDDLFPPGGQSNINYYTTGTAPNRKFVYNFNDVAQCCNNIPRAKQQVVLHETTNEIEIHTTYVQVTFGQTQGLEDENGEFAFPVPNRNNASWSATNDYRRFIPCCDQQIIEVTGPAIAIASDSVSCFGDTDGQLTANVSVGLQPYTYAWNDPGNQTTQTASNLGVGVYTVTVTDANGCTSEESGTMGTPLDLAASFSNIDNLCQGDDTATSTVMPTGGVQPYSYNWNTGQTSPSTTGLTAGVYMVTVTDVNGCTDVFSTVVNDLNPKPPLNLGADSAICEGELYQLLADPGFIQYIWSTGDTNQFVDVSTAGNYAVTATAPGGCTNEDDINITTVTPDPGVTVPNDTSLAPWIANQNNPYPVSADAGFATYEWFPNGETTQTINVTLPGLYAVEATDSKGCTSNDTIIIDIWPVGLEELVEGSFSLYPNPNNGSFRITNKGADRKVTMQIVDVKGQLVHEEGMTLGADSYREVSVEGLSKGIYFVQMITADEVEQFRMVIE